MRSLGTCLFNLFLKRKVNMERDLETIEDLGEFEFIRSISQGCIHGPEGILQGIGDDCAVIGPFGDKVLLVTTDLLVENVHFILDRTPARHLGEKAVAVNLSDIAAMGGVPRHLFVSLAIPHSFPLRILNALYEGMKEVCRAYGVNLLGGDTSASLAGLFINVAVIGEAMTDQVLYRKGASPGDSIYVTGPLGEAAAGLKILKGQIEAGLADWPSLIKALTRPRPQVEEGRIIAKSGLASAMIDLSDGLVADLGHICEASDSGAEILEECLPLSNTLISFAKKYNQDPIGLCLWGGEDYQLLITVPAANGPAFERMFKEKGCGPVYKIGKITEGRRIRCVRPDGTERVLHGVGFDHFKEAGQ
ncbi:MAG: thiamine-phosphate kinase [Deltaproteobacteria bacterium]|nr:MAG: thiamine-phosphate kinase [Deltaproteobacteria bacterium]